MRPTGCVLGLTKLGSLWWIQVTGSLARDDMRRLAVLVGRLGTFPPATIICSFPSSPV